MDDRKHNGIFYGDGSRDMWKWINKAKTKKDLRYALYGVCCRIQELEGLVREIKASTVREEI